MLMVQPNNSGGSSDIQKGQLVKVSVRDPGFPIYAVPSSESGEAFGNRLRNVALLFPETACW